MGLLVASSVSKSASKKGKQSCDRRPTCTCLQLSGGPQRSSCRREAPQPSHRVPLPLSWDAIQSPPSKFSHCLCQCQVPKQILGFPSEASFPVLNMGQSLPGSFSFWSLESVTDTQFFLQNLSCRSFFLPISTTQGLSLLPSASKCSPLPEAPTLLSPGAPVNSRKCSPSFLGWRSSKCSPKPTIALGNMLEMQALEPTQTGWMESAGGGAYPPG